MFMPCARADGGKKDRKSRADLARGEKGLNRVVTSVMNLVIIFALWSLVSGLSLLLPHSFFPGEFARGGCPVVVFGRERCCSIGWSARARCSRSWVGMFVILVLN
jgi:hypothetical protein